MNYKKPRQLIPIRPNTNTSASNKRMDKCSEFLVSFNIKNKIIKKSDFYSFLKNHTGRFGKLPTRYKKAPT